MQVRQFGSSSHSCKYDNLEAAAIKELYISVFNALRDIVDGSTFKRRLPMPVTFGIPMFRSAVRKILGFESTREPIAR